MNIVWLKRDARLIDHEPLVLAASRELPLLLLYIYEPCHLQSDVYHESHHRFINEGLVDLDERVRALSASGAGITFRKGNSVDVLTQLHKSLPVHELFSHNEVGNGISLERNQQVAQWAEQNGVKWTQCKQDGVCECRLQELEEGSWAKRWLVEMSRNQFTAPTSLHMVSPGVVPPGSIMDAQSCGVVHLGTRPGAQRGGETVGRAMLGSFFGSRGESYAKELSSPLTAWESCSRLSPYLAWGHLSLRHVFQELTRQQEKHRVAKTAERNAGCWLKSLAAFGARLRWRSHFSQKLHDEPSIERHNMCRAYDAIRTEFDVAKYDAWVKGRTGFPMIDACMRALHHSGWINFRMRCMLVSFACYMLWLDWKHLTSAMARVFLDYEPGIHYPQFQMQAGTTGINSNRMYSPAKQAEDHDPDGIFIKRWVPELCNVPRKYIAQPHTMPEATQLECGCVIGRDYPLPIVDHAEAYRHALSELARVRAQAETKAEAAAVYRKHGSRKRPGSNARLPTASKRALTELPRSAAAESVPGTGEVVDTSDDFAAPFVAEAASSGQSRCRGCGEAIAKGSCRVSVACKARGWSRGQITAHHHLECFARNLQVEVCPSSRGKCKHSGDAFVKGHLRFAYCTTGAGGLSWINLESSRELLPPLVKKVPDWTLQWLAGLDKLPTAELRAQAEEVFSRINVNAQSEPVRLGSWSHLRRTAPCAPIDIDADDDS